MNDIILKRLQSPLDPNRVKQREGASGRRLSYIETWDAKRAANDIFGYGKWGYEVVELDDIGIEKVVRKKDGAEGHRVAYRCRVHLRVDGCLPVEDVGYGEDISYSSVLQSHELAAKEAVSDALKRALVAFGDQFGLGLYDKTAPSNRAAPRSSSPPRARAGSRTPSKKLRAAQIRLVTAAKDADVDDTLRHRIIYRLTEGYTESVRDLDDDACDKITAQLGYFKTNREASMRRLEEWEKSHA